MLNEICALYEQKLEIDMFPQPNQPDQLQTEQPAEVNSSSAVPDGVATLPNGTTKLANSIRVAPKILVYL